MGEMADYYAEREIADYYEKMSKDSKYHDILNENVWHQGNGEPILIREMTDDHLVNSINKIKRENWRLEYLSILEKELESRKEVKMKNNQEFNGAYLRSLMYREAKIELEELKIALEETAKNGNSTYFVDKELSPYTVNSISEMEGITIDGGNGYPYKITW